MVARRLFKLLSSAAVLFIITDQKKKRIVGDFASGIGVPMTVECDKVTALPENIPSLTAQVNIPGQEGGI